VRITGHSDVADTVEYAMEIAGKAQVTNAQNAHTYYDRGIAKQKKGDLKRRNADLLGRRLYGQYLSLSCCR